MINSRIRKDADKCIQVFAGVGLLGTCLLLLLSFYSSLDLPEVYQDAISEACVAVVTSEGVQPCEGNVPARYVPVLVAPGQTYQQIADTFPR